MAVRRAGVRPWWLVCWLAVLAAGGRPPCWRSVRGWCPSVAVVAVFVARGGLSAVRWSTGPPWPFRGPWRPVWALCACLTFGSIPPPLVARRRWCAVLVLACLVCAVGGRGGRVAGRPCWCRWCRCHCAVPWPVVRVAGRQYGPPCGGVLVVSLRRALLGRVPCPSVRAGVRRGGRWPSVRPCWCAGVRSVAGGRFLPYSVAVAARLGRRWCWCPSLVLVARVGLAGWPCGPCQWWRRWLAVLALAVVLAYFKERWPLLAGGGPCAVLSVVVVSACLVCGGPCWCRTSGGRGRPSNQRTEYQRPPWRPCWRCVLLASVGGVGGGRCWRWCWRWRWCCWTRCGTF